MAQLSFYSAEANTPCAGDLAGLLCCQGQLAGFARTAARLSVVVDEAWRAGAVRAALAERGIDAGVTTAADDRPLVRTAFRADLVALAAAWTAGPTTGTGKVAPPGLTLDGAALRLWVLAAGGWLEGSYLLGLDPNAPRTYEPLGGAVAGCGLQTSLICDADTGPGLRISGRRRLGRLAELVGRPPLATAESHWPAVSRVRVST